MGTAMVRQAEDVDVATSLGVVSVLTAEPSSGLTIARRIASRFDVMTLLSLSKSSSFMNDLASRLRGRVQISADALRTYVDAVDYAFGSDVDFGQLVESYEAEPVGPGRYSPPKVVAVERKAVWGQPRPGPYLDELHRAPESHDADAGPAAHSSSPTPSARSPRIHGPRLRFISRTTTSFAGTGHSRRRTAGSTPLRQWPLA